MVHFDPDVDYYEILQVHPNAHHEVIKRAFRTIVGMLQAHPDLGGTHEDALRVNEAYQVLSHPETRQAYDTARERKRSPQLNRVTRVAATHAYAAHRSHHNTTHIPSTPSTHLETSAQQMPGTQTVYCPGCGARNRLPLPTKLHLAVCGKCHAPLFSAPRETHTPPVLPAVGTLKLTATLTQRLLAEGEVCLQRALLPADRRLTCLRCHYEWLERDGEAPPHQCPHCHSAHWSEIRLFRCLHCAHQFVTRDLTTWPYGLFTECPACHRRNWHPGCERHPLRWVLNKLTG
ncbi:MAG TPA: DnaJ domain-containing protein [Armatimonadota bacterium]|jgi:hypothetical protein